LHPQKDALGGCRTWANNHSVITTNNHTSHLTPTSSLRTCLKILERGCVVLDQPQQSSNFSCVWKAVACCGWSMTQPRSFFRQALKDALNRGQPGLGGKAKNMKTHLLIFMVTLLFAFIGRPASIDQSRPNIVYILADDLGYGDVQCLNPQHVKIKTPTFDRLAAQGMTFTDAHAGASVCTPTRYGILTGRYAWRTRLQRGVLDNYVEPLIAPDRLTVPALLKEQGYHTACVGKWHLGFTIQEKAERDNREQFPGDHDKFAGAPMALMSFTAFTMRARCGRCSKTTASRSFWNRLKCCRR
jgi:hypothetical protein